MWRSIGIGMLALSGVALADTGARMHSVVSAAELRVELYGVRLAGVAGLDQAPWEECIEPDGTSVYRFRGVEQVGFMHIHDNGVVCFDYGQGHQSTNCFRVSRRGDGYTFYGGAGSGGVFEATQVEREIETCPRSPGPLS